MMKMRMMTTMTKMIHCGAKSPLLGSGGDCQLSDVVPWARVCQESETEGLGKGKGLGGGEQEVCV